jgi:hypothetical protein
MRDINGEARLQLQPQGFLRRNGAALQLAACYGAFALIAGIVLGSVSVHPF